MNRAMNVDPAGRAARPPSGHAADAGAFAPPRAWGTLDDPEARRLAALDVLPDLSDANGADARTLASLLIAAPSTLPREVVIWASELQQRSQGAVADHLLERALDRFQAAPELLSKRIQVLLALGRVEDAADLSQRWADWPTSTDRLADLVVTALDRAKRKTPLVEFYDARGSTHSFGPRAAAAIMRSLEAVGRIDDAIHLGESTIAESPGGCAAVHAILARIHDAADRIDDAIRHYESALEESPQDVRCNSALGRLLLIAGRAAPARDVLERASTAAPHLVQTRMLLARALNRMGEFAEAAEVMAAIDQREIADNFVARRHVISALSFAGRKDEAADLYDDLLVERDRRLPDSLADGLDAISDRIDDARLPQSRLDWAFRLRDAARYPDRSRWEYAAKWGFLADMLLLDWVECRTEAAEEAMRLLADLDRADRVIGEARAGGEAVILASAHLGALYAGPLILELLGLPCRWLASTPSLDNAPYRASLISTSDQTEAQVARSVVRAMGSGESIVVAVDGAMSMSAPRVSLEGRSVTYSDFAARLVHKRSAPSLFAVPYWTPERRVELYVEPMPRPERGEDQEQFCHRWRTEYFRHVGRFLKGSPENLRLSGGIWRGIGQGSRSSSA